MKLEEVKDIIRGRSVEEAVHFFLFRDAIAAFDSPEKYKSYIELVKGDYPGSERILIGGSGNWGYSFNPQKMYRQFSDTSDIDLVIVSEEHFEKTWAEIRIYHRKFFYRINHHQRDILRRHGEDIYSGFVTPKWLPDKTSHHYVEYLELANKYGNDLVNYRMVNLMYFKNVEELTDYYKRSFLKVREERNGI